MSGPAPSLILRAGASAYRRICQQGLRPADVHLIPGAAGGAKALGILGLDLALFGEWLPRVRQMRTLVGSSIGSWRFASACLPDPRASLQRLGELYSAQRFTEGMDAAEISRRCSVMLEDLLQGQGRAVLDHPDYRLCILADRSRGLAATRGQASLSLGVLGIVLANAVSRRGLGLFLQRYLFADPALPQPWHDVDGFRTHRVALNADNLHAALLASASIPLVMQGVSDPPGAPAGLYRDGGLIDYHLNLPWKVPGVILFPHFIDRVIPGWFDKPLRWRHAQAPWLDQVLLVAPSPQYLARLPLGKLPDRKDFKRFQGDDAGRERYWRQAMAESQRLGDEFLELVDSGRIAEHIRPLI